MNGLPTTSAPRDRALWAGAMAGALALHGLAFWWVQRAPQPPTTPRANASWQARVVPPRKRPDTTPARDIAAPAPAERRPAQSLRAPAVAARSAAASHALPSAPPVRSEPPVAPHVPEPLPSPPADDTMQWLDANLADQAPAPVGNEWRLAEMPWPAAHPQVQVRLWITPEGRIARFELQGPAADDPAMQALFAPFAGTLMQPARIGRAAVPSTMLIEIWPGEDARPDFLLPLPSASDPATTAR